MRRSSSRSGAPRARELVGFGRGYHAHARLLGSFIGGRIASERDKERARPIYLHGTWGAFDTLLEDAIAASVPVLDAAAAVLDASSRDVEAGRAALARVLPPGSIDPDGMSVELDAPFRVQAALGTRFATGPTTT